MLAFAAGIGDCSELTLSDAEPAFMASPYMIVSPEWKVAKVMMEGSSLGLSSQEAATALHVGQDTVFHNSLTAGQQLVLLATVVMIKQTAAGVLTCCKLESSDEGSGEPVATSYLTTLYRGVVIEGDPGIEEPVPADNYLAATDSCEQLKISLGIPREFLHIYTACADIYNPIHTETSFARALGLPDILVHGTALWALAGREIVKAFGKSDPRNLARLCGRFGAMVMPDTNIDIIQYRHPERPDTICFSVINEAGEEAISQGVAQLKRRSS